MTLHLQITRAAFGPGEFASEDANGLTAGPTFPRPRVTLYTKADCTLCDDVRADLDLLAGETGFELREIDITSSDRLFERFRYLIPVVDIGGGELLTPPLSMRRLRDAITAASTPNG